MKYIFTALIALTGTFSFSQSLNEARNYFDNFEYERAAEIFQNEHNNSKLELEDLKRLVYSHYVTGDFVSCQIVADELIEKDTKIEPLFLLISGDANRGIGNYSKAISSYEKYQSSEGSEEDVTMKIRSCREITNWDDEDYISFSELDSNGKMADISGGIYNGNVIHFEEIGFDKMQSMLGVVRENSESFAELLLTQPSIVFENDYVNIFMKDSSMASVSSIAFLPNSNTAILTISYPLSTDPLVRAPNLYWAELTENKYFESVEPFEYSGLKDTSSTAHATINSSGDKMIFTKANDRTKGSDLYISTKVNGEWNQPKELEALNTNGDEMFPLFQNDTILSFSSNGRVGYGGLDIYYSQFPIESAKIEHYKAPINSFKDDFNLTFMDSDSAVFVSNRDAGTGDDDLYYIVYKSEEPEVDTFNVNDFISTWKTKNVYFDFDQFKLSKSLSSKNITALNTFFEKCSECQIELTGFTDSRGSDQYNLKLSEKRAEEVKRMLIKAGFSKENIRVIAKGETNQPFDCGGNCSLEQHKLNRVVEINIVKN